MALFQALSNQFSQAGRIHELDALASKFFTATGAARDAIYKEASVLVAEVGPAATHYLRVMEKVINGTEDYITKESKRYVGLFSVTQIPFLSCITLLMTFRPPFYSLASILQKRVLASAKLDEIKIKANIVAAFAAEKVAEARDTIERAIEDL
jgi:protein disulfide-isomerase A6